jgi:hypothetical protein
MIGGNGVLVGSGDGVLVGVKLAVGTSVGVAVSVAKTGVRVSVTEGVVPQPMTAQASNTSNRALRAARENMINSARK